MHVYDAQNHTGTPNDTRTQRKVTLIMWVIDFSTQYSQEPN